MSNPINYVLYHAFCIDGLAAAYAASLKLGFEKTEYIPVRHGEPIPESIPRDNSANVYILDFSYPRDELEKLKAEVGSLLVLDHHASAKEDLEGLDYCIFDMTKSGCVIAWEYFNMSIPPYLFMLIQDRDLWKFNLPFTKEVSAFLRYNAATITDIQYFCDTKPIKEMAKVGSIIWDTEYRIAVKQTSEVVIFPFFVTDKNVLRTLQIALFNATICISDSCNLALETKNVDLAICFRYKPDGIVLSFRSHKNGFPCHKLAAALGGGGHPSAAGALVPDCSTEYLLCLLEKKLETLTTEDWAFLINKAETSSEAPESIQEASGTDPLEEPSKSNTEEPGESEEESEEASGYKQQELFSEPEEQEISDGTDQEAING